MDLGMYLDKKKGHTVNKITADKTIMECIELLNDRRVGALVVVDKDDNLEGIVSERDILRKGIKNLTGKVNEIMTPKSKLISSEISDSIVDVMKRFRDNKIRHMPVLDNGKVVGIISIGDVINELLSMNIQENEQLKNYIHAQY